MVQLQRAILVIALVVSGCAHPSNRVRPVAPPPIAVTGPAFYPVTAGSVQQPVPMERVPAVEHTANQDGSMTLTAAIELALRNSDIVRVSRGTSVTADPATLYDVAVAESRVLAALAAFDTSWAADFYGSSIRLPPNAFFGPGFQEPTLRDESSFNLGLNKRWRTGAKTAVSFNPDPAYLYLPGGNGSGFNPTYTGEMEISVSQPLLRGSGLEVNSAPIRVRQMQTEQSAWEFKKAVMASARSVAAAYWDLYAARVTLGAITEVLPLLEEIVRLQEESYRAEWVIQADVAKAYALLYEFRQRQLSAQSAVVGSELRLRNLMNVPPEDGWTIVPVTDPGKMQVAIDPDYAVYAAIENHPDLVRQRIETKIRQLELVVARNGLLPNFDIRALYQMNGVGEDVGGTIRQMFTAEYSDWLVGFTLSVPLGNRQATARERAGELQLARADGLLHQEVTGVVHEIRDDIRTIHFSYQEFTQANRRQAAAADWLSGSRLRYENPRPGSGANWLLQSLNEYLFALRFHTEAKADAALVLARYNTALIELEETKGTLLEFLNIDLAADPCRQSEWLPVPPHLLTTARPAPARPVAPPRAPTIVPYTTVERPEQELPLSAPSQLRHQAPADLPAPASILPPIERGLGSDDRTPSVIPDRRLPSVPSPSRLAPHSRPNSVPTFNAPSQLN
jgi:outer membrane protein TolC